MSPVQGDGEMPHRDTAGRGGGGQDFVMQGVQQRKRRPCQWVLALSPLSAPRKPKEQQSGGYCAVRRSNAFLFFSESSM